MLFCSSSSYQSVLSSKFLCLHFVYLYLPIIFFPLILASLSLQFVPCIRCTCLILFGRFGFLLKSCLATDYLEVPWPSFSCHVIFNILLIKHFHEYHMSYVLSQFFAYFLSQFIYTGFRWNSPSTRLTFPIDGLKSCSGIRCRLIPSQEPLKAQQGQEQRRCCRVSV